MNPPDLDLTALMEIAERAIFPFPELQEEEVAWLDAQQFFGVSFTPDTALAILTRLVAAEGESTRWVLCLADIREASGVGATPMLSELPDAIRAKIQAAEARAEKAEADRDAALCLSSLTSSADEVAALTKAEADRDFWKDGGHAMIATQGEDVTQTPAFNRETVARIIDGAMRRALAMPPSDQKAWRFTADKSAAAIMGLHDADPAHQMADAEAALWREHDARHSAAAVRPVDEGEIADTISALEDLATHDENYAWRLNRRAADVLILAAAELSRLRADLADAVGVLEPLAARYEVVAAQDGDPPSAKCMVATSLLRAAAALFTRLKDASCD